MPQSPGPPPEPLRPRVEPPGRRAFHDPDAESFGRAEQSLARITNTITVATAQAIDERRETAGYDQLFGACQALQLVLDEARRQLLGE